MWIFKNANSQISPISLKFSNNFTVWQLGSNCLWKVELVKWKVEFLKSGQVWSCLKFVGQTHRHTDRQTEFNIREKPGAMRPHFLGPCRRSPARPAKSGSGPTGPVWRQLIKNDLDLFLLDTAAAAAAAAGVALIYIRIDWMQYVCMHVWGLF